MNMSVIKPEYLTLDDLLKKRFFEIPNYQRTYSWVKKQRDDLFDDIKKILTWKDKERHHFMATIVCLDKPKESKEVGTDLFNKFDIVDGQQRITTLIILLKAISKSLAKGTVEEKEQSKIINELMVKIDKRIILLQTNHDNNQIFRNYLEKGEKPDKKSIKTFTDQNLFDAFEECENFVKPFQYKPGLLKLLSIIKNRLGFIFYVLKDSGSVYTVFEVLNSRGLEVDWLDKCKSKLMGVIYEKYGKKIALGHINELHKKWTEIYRTIGKADISGEEIVKFTATLLSEKQLNKPLSAEDSVEYLSEICIRDRNKVFEVIEFISKVTGKLKEIYETPRQKAVTKISQARLLAVAIMLSRLDKKEKDILLEQWERMTFRIYGLSGYDSRTSVGDYVRLSKKLFSEKMKFRKIKEELLELGSNYSIKEATGELNEANCYEGWEEQLRYFFFRYEEYLAKKSKSNINEEMWNQIWKESPTNSIEHIFPQTLNKTNGCWKGKLGTGKNIIEKHKHRLGNLLIVPPKINSQLGNKCFVDKLRIYKQLKLRIVDEISSCKDWNLNAIKRREKRLIKWAKETWDDI
jgi:uncharacterized protein with ParB-like and HNH nuclease domain